MSFNEINVKNVISNMHIERRTVAHLTNMD